MPDFHVCQLPKIGKPPKEFHCWMCGQDWMLVQRAPWMRKNAPLYGWIRIRKKRLGRG